MLEVFRVMITIVLEIFRGHDYDYHCGRSIDGQDYHCGGIQGSTIIIPQCVRGI